MLIVVYYIQGGGQHTHQPTDTRKGDTHRTTKYSESPPSLSPWVERMTRHTSQDHRSRDEHEQSCGKREKSSTQKTIYFPVPAISQACRWKQIKREGLKW